MSQVLEEANEERVGEGVEDDMPPPPPALNLTTAALRAPALPSISSMRQLRSDNWLLDNLLGRMFEVTVATAEVAAATAPSMTAVACEVANSL